MKELHKIKIAECMNRPSVYSCPSNENDDPEVVLCSEGLLYQDPEYRLHTMESLLTQYNTIWKSTAYMLVLLGIVAEHVCMFSMNLLHKKLH